MKLNKVVKNIDEVVYEYVKVRRGWVTKYEIDALITDLFNEYTYNINGGVRRTLASILNHRYYTHLM